jgi:hypothetical protein
MVPIRQRLRARRVVSGRREQLALQRRVAIPASLSTGWPPSIGIGGRFASDSAAKRVDQDWRHRDDEASGRICPRSPCHREDGDAGPAASCYELNDAVLTREPCLPALKLLRES